MTLRLDNLVVRGELDCSGYYSVTGWLELCGTDRVLHLQLTGKPAPDLAGWHIRFKARPAPAADAAPPEGVDLDALHWQQIGPTGRMTFRRDGKPRLTLEWFGQDGRVLVDMTDAVVEFLDHSEEEHVSVLDPIRWPDDSNEEGVDAEDDDAAAWEEGDDEDDDEDDPYGLFPKDLERQLAEEVSLADDDKDVPENPLPADERAARDLREMELMDDLIEQGPGEVIGSLFDVPLRLPRPDDLDDAGAEKALKAVLAQMALWGIQLHLCVHFTPRDAYRLVVEYICRQGRSYPELRRTQWVQGYTTSEFCTACEDELMREIEEMERKRDEGEGPPPPSDDDELPF